MLKGCTRPKWLLGVFELALNTEPIKTFPVTECNFPQHQARGDYQQYNNAGLVDPGYDRNKSIFPLE